MSGKDRSVTSKESLAGTKPGKQILRQGMFKSKGYRAFARYRNEAHSELPAFSMRFASDLLLEIRNDQNPASAQEEFAQEIKTDAVMLDSPAIPDVKSRLENADTLQDRVNRILNSNFVKMTLPVFSALYDAAGEDPQLKQDMVDGHIMAIDLSEPMDRIVDKDEDLEYLDDYRLMCPYILRLARRKISKGGDLVLKEFESGFQDALDGQAMDTMLKEAPAEITDSAMNRCYKKYRAIMGTAGRNMALARRPLGEIFYLGMARAAESAGCGNEIEDSLKGEFVKVPSWPLYYTHLSGDIKAGFDATLQKSRLYLQDARLALELLPESFSHREFLEFLFLTLEHYNEFWYKQLHKAGIWQTLESRMPV